MKIRSKIIIIIATASFLSMLVLIIVFQTVLLGQFSNLENSYVNETTQRAGNMLQMDINNLGEAAPIEFGVWNDTYNFIQGLDPGYIQANFNTSESLESIGCQGILFINSTGQDYYNLYYDSDYQNEVPFPAALSTEILSEPELWNFTNGNQYLEGVICTPGEAFIFGASPIVHNDFSGPVLGAVVLFKAIDTNEIQSIQDRAGVQLTIWEVNSTTESSPGFQEAYNYFLQGNSIYIKAANSSTIYGYESIDDAFGHPALILRVEMPRNIWYNGLITTDYYAVMVLASIFLVALTFFVLLERTVISRLSGLTASVKDLEKIEKFVDKGNTGWANQICEEKGNDEISTLASSINWMVWEMRVKNDKLQHSEKMAAVGQMVTQIGHDLRNPLTGIKNSVYILKKKFRDISDDETKEILDLLDYDVKYSNRIINDILDYSRESKLDLMPTSPQTAVNDAIFSVEPPSNILLVNEVLAEPKVDLDRQRIKRAFINIITNAIEAMPDGGTLRISSKVDGSNIKISFSDTGTGISESKMQKLWTPFDTTKAKGLGLGLAIAKQVIDAHEGNILVESKDGVGTTFTFVLPIKTSEGGDKQ